MKFSIIISVILIFSNEIFGQFSGTSCKNNDGTAGVCRKFADCVFALTEIKTSRLTPRDFKQCGFEKSNPIICCKEDVPLPFENKIQTEKPEEGAIVFNSDYDDIPTSRKSIHACEMIQNIKAPIVVNYHILAGEPVELGEFPHQVALGYPTLENNIINYDCGGSLISRNFILTASHCVNKKNRQPSTVRLGRASLDDNDENDSVPPVDIDIKQGKIYLHPNFTSVKKYNDIALIELAEPVTYTKFVKPACLDSTSVSSRTVETPMIITGWGIIETNTGNKSHWLMKATINEVPLDECKKSFSKQIYSRELPESLLSTQMCATGVTTVGARIDACQGDSGGPLQFKNLASKTNETYYTIVGVTSFGAACGSDTSPGVYTRVSEFLDWIEKIVWPNAVEI